MPLPSRQIAQHHHRHARGRSSSPLRRDYLTDHDGASPSRTWLDLHVDQEIAHVVEHLSSRRRRRIEHRQPAGSSCAIEQHLDCFNGPGNATGELSESENTALANRSDARAVVEPSVAATFADRLPGLVRVPRISGNRPARCRSMRRPARQPRRSGRNRPSRRRQNVLTRSSAVPKSFQPAAQRSVLSATHKGVGPATKNIGRAKKISR